MPRVTEISRAEKLAKVAWMDERGYTVRQIAQEFDVTHKVASQWVNHVNDEWHHQQLLATDKKAARITRQYNMIFHEAWLAYEKSKEDTSKKTVEKVSMISSDGTPEGERKRLQEVIEKRLPASNYLNIMLQCLQGIRDVGGVDQPKQVHAQVEGGLTLEMLLNGEAFTSQTNKITDPFAKEILALDDGSEMEIPSKD